MGVFLVVVVVVVALGLPVSFSSPPSPSSSPPSSSSSTPSPSPLKIQGQSIFLVDPHASIIYTSQLKRWIIIADGNGGLKVADVDSASLQLVGYLEMSAARDLTSMGSFAFVAAGDGLMVVEISNPVFPAVVGSLRTFSPALGVATFGNMAYVADGDGGLLVVNVGNPSSPTLLGVSLIEEATAVACTANQVFVVGKNGLNIISVQNPSNPTVTHTIQGVLSDSSIAVKTIGPTLFCIAVNLGYATQVLSIPTSGSSAPQVVATLNGILASTVSVGSVSNNAYLSTPSGLRVLDLSGLPQAAPVDIGFLRQSAPLLDVGVSPDESLLCLVSENGLKIATPLTKSVTPSVLSTTPFASVYVNNAEVIGSLAYLATTDLVHSKGGLVIMDVSDPTTPLSRGSVDVGGANAVEVVVDPVSGKVYAFLAVSITSYTAGKLVIVDATSPTSPRVIGEKKVQQLGNSVAVSYESRLAFLGCSSNPILLINVIDFSNITNPSMIMMLYAASSIIEFIPSSSLLVNLGNTMNVINVSAANIHRSPQIAGFTTIQQQGNIVTIVGALAYIAISNYNDASMQIANTSDPYNILALGHVSFFAESCLNVIVRNNFAYILTNKHIYIADISNSTNPFLLPGSYTIPPNAQFIGAMALYESPSTRALIAYISVTWMYQPGSSVLCVDVSNPNFPLVQNVAMNLPVNQFVVDTNTETIYGASALNSGSITGTLLVLDAKNATNITVVSQFSLGANGGGNGIALLQQSSAVVVTTFTKNGGNILVIDVSTPSTPRIITTLPAPANYQPRCLTMKDDKTAYVAMNGMTQGFISVITAIDLSVLTNPIIVGSVLTSINNILSIDSSNPVAYFAVVGNQFMQLVANGDFSSVPQVLSKFSFLTGSQDTSSIAIPTPDLAYISIYDLNGTPPGALIICNITNPFSPNVLSTTPFGQGTQDVAVANNRALVALCCPGTSGSGALSIVNTTDINQPSIMFTVTIALAPYSVFASSDAYAYVSASSSGTSSSSGSFTIVNIESIPLKLRSTIPILPASSLQSVLILSRSSLCALVGGTSLQVVDVSNPSSPSVINVVDTQGDILAMTETSMGYVAAVLNVTSTTTSGLKLQLLDVNIVNANATVRVLGSIMVSNTTCDVTSVTTSADGGYAIVTCTNIQTQSNPSSTFLLVNIVLPNALTIAGQMQLSGTALYEVVSDMRYCYVASSYGLLVIDISNAAQPKQVSSLSIATGVLGITFTTAIGHQSYAYLASSWYGMQVVDISQPLNPTIVGQFRIGTGAIDVAGEDNIVFVATGPSGIVCIDVSSPTSPVLANGGMLSSIGTTHVVTVLDDFVYVLGGIGLSIIDVSVYFPGKLTLLQWFKANSTYLAAAAGTLGGLATFSAVVWRICLKERFRKKGKEVDGTTVDNDEDGKCCCKWWKSKKNKQSGQELEHRLL